MGYETTLLIGRDTKTTFISKESAVYFQVYAHVDMGKLGNSKLLDLPWINKTPEDIFWYWYAPTGDGDTQIEEDRYGEKPRPMPIATVIQALKEDIKNDDYERLKWALALLESMPDGDLSVLLYGY
jgi:hypothetical protein